MLPSYCYESLRVNKVVGSISRTLACPDWPVQKRLRIETGVLDLFNTASLAAAFAETIFDYFDLILGLNFQSVSMLKESAG